MIPEFKGDLLQWLRGFYSLAQTGSMTEAMREMKRTQSALTYQIRSLEKEFGAKLFKGNGDKRELTAEGRKLFDKTLSVFGLLSKIKQDIVMLPQIVSGEIKICTIYTTLQSFLPERTAPFRDMYPSVSFRIFAEVSKDSMLDMVKRGVCDVALLCVDAVPKDLLAIPLFRTEVAVIAPRSGPNSVSGEPVLEEIAAMPSICTMDQTTLQLFLDEQFGRYGLKQNKAHMITHYEGAKAYVSKGYGITFMDCFACTEDDDKNFSIVSLYPYFPKRTMSAVVRNNRFIPTYLQTFLDFISAEYKETPAEIVFERKA